LIENKDSAYISRELAYLGGDLDSPLDLSDFVPKSMDKDKLRSYFREFELQRFLAALDLAEAFHKADTDKKESAKGHDSHPGHAGSAGSAGHDAKGQISHKEGQVDYARYLLVQSDDDMENLTKALKDAKKIALDLETDSKDASVANIVGISLSTSENIAFYIPIDHSALKEGEVNLDLDLTLNILEKYLLSKDKELYGQNAKYDWLILARHNLVLPEPKGDPMLASYLYDPDSGHDLDGLSAQFLGHNTITYKEVVPDKKMTFRDVSLVDATRYSGEDSDVTLRLSKILDEKLKEDRALSLLYQHIELPLEYVLVFMEAAGILVDKEVLKEVSKSLASEMKDLESDIFKLAGSEFNLSSPRQVGKVLFEDLKLKPVKRTSKTKSYSTDVEVLTELSISEPIAQKLLNYRELDKLKGTYADKLALYINPKTHRIHTSFNQTRAVTGRLSSSEPNLQNIPAKTENGRRIREAFMAGEGNVLISADYSQIELRVMAEFSKDSALIEAFKNDEDIHRETAAKVFGINPQDVSPEERQRAKAINFGIIYGQSASGLGRILKIDTREAASFISLYFTRFPGVKAFMEEAIERARHTQKATTLFGRRRFLPNILLMNHSIRGEAERMAINTPIQGTAADLIKIAMIKVHNRFIKDKVKGRILLQVHDELIVEAPEDEAEKVKDILVGEMAAAGSKEFFPGAPVLSVPLKVDSSISKRWSHA
jgi:DNA polymerase-1